MLTGIGFAGSVITAGSLIVAAFFGRIWLIVGVLGFLINWFGDSLDGRVAYFRNKPRKWFGFSLDLIVDWFTDILIGLGYIIFVDQYLDSLWTVLLGFGFVVLYGWSIMMALLRYKVVNKYTIDSGLFGPTEVRLFICIILILEVLVPHSIVYSVALVCLILFVVNVADFRKLLQMADQRDKEEKAAK
jgi:phosphatidylglycerophosphate synthase